jgi:hypothetical protein
MSGYLGLSKVDVKREMWRCPKRAAISGFEEVQPHFSSHSQRVLVVP